MKHKEHNKRKSFAKWAKTPTVSTPTHKCITHHWFRMKPVNQIIKLKVK